MSNIQEYRYFVRTIRRCEKLATPRTLVSRKINVRPPHFWARYPTGIILLFSVVGVAAAAETRRIRLLYCTATDERLHTTYLAWPRQ